MTLRCPHPHVPPFDTVDLPDKYDRPGWVRLLCRQCGVFIGCQAPEEMARAAGGPGVDLKIPKRNQKSAPRRRPSGAIDYVRGHFGP